MRLTWKWESRNLKENESWNNVEAPNHVLQVRLVAAVAELGSLIWLSFCQQIRRERWKGFQELPGKGKRKQMGGGGAGGVT
jgi:hypothetical protein